MTPNNPKPELEPCAQWWKDYAEKLVTQHLDNLKRHEATIESLTAERDALQRWKDIRAAEITDDQKRMAALEAERDASGDELGRVVLACPMSPRYRMHPTSAGVRNLRKDFEASAAAIARLTAERDKWRNAWMDSAHEEAEAYRERDEAIERVAVLETALGKSNEKVRAIICAAIMALPLSEKGDHE